MAKQGDENYEMNLKFKDANITLDQTYELIRLFWKDEHIKKASQ